MAQAGRGDGAGRAPMSALRRIKAILGGSAGNLVEWYDWFAYSSTSLYFAALFFPKGDAVAQQLQTAAIFAAGFVDAPDRRLADGRLRRPGRAPRGADPVGRADEPGLLRHRRSCRPTPRSASLAQLGLLAARLVQGLSLGGEYGASATYMSRDGRQGSGAASGRRFQYTTLIGGQVAALLVLVVLQHVLSQGRPGGLGLAHPLRHRRRAGDRGVLDPDQPGGEHLLHHGGGRRPRAARSASTCAGSRTAGRRRWRSARCCSPPTTPTPEPVGRHPGGLAAQPRPAPLF